MWIYCDAVEHHSEALTVRKASPSDKRWHKVGVYTVFLHGNGFASSRSVNLKKSIRKEVHLSCRNNRTIHKGKRNGTKIQSLKASACTEQVLIWQPFDIRISPRIFPFTVTVAKVPSRRDPWVDVLNIPPILSLQFDWPPFSRKTISQKETFFIVV